MLYAKYYVTTKRLNDLRKIYYDIGHFAVLCCIEPTKERGSVKFSFISESLHLFLQSLFSMLILLFPFNLSNLIFAIHTLCNKYTILGRFLRTQIAAGLHNKCSTFSEQSNFLWEMFSQESRRRKFQYILQSCCISPRTWQDSIQKPTKDVSFP